MPRNNPVAPNPDVSAKQSAVLGPEPDMVSIRNGRLFVDDVPADELVERFGSPLFAYSETQLRTNVRRITAAMAAEWHDGPVDVLPAFKANPMIATRRILTEEGAGADVYSPGELEGALRAGVEPSLISVNGGGKSRAQVRRCVEAGVRITVEDVDEIDLIQQVAAELATTAKVRFRVKPEMLNLWRRSDFTSLSIPIDLVAQIYKAGIPPEYLVDMGRRVFAMPNVELVGLHLHVGRQNATAWYWRGVMRQYARLIIDLCEAWGGWRPQEIDCGGGFPSSRDPMNKETSPNDFVLTAAGYLGMVGLRGLGAGVYHRVIGKLLPQLLSRAEPVYPEPIEVLVSAAITTLRRELEAGGIETRGVRLQMEPGRSLYANAAVHLTRAKTVKRQNRPLPYTWVLTDTTQFFLAGGVFEHNRYPVVVAGRADSPSTTLVDVVGQSCFGDVLVPGVRLPEVQRGDVIALLDTGAYQESSASNFNALPRPGTVLVSGTEVDVIRRAETDEDVWARDVLPQRLTHTTP